MAAIFSEVQRHNAGGLSPAISSTFQKLPRGVAYRVDFAIDPQPASGRNPPGLSNSQATETDLLPEGDRVQQIGPTQGGPVLPHLSE